MWMYNDVELLFLSVFKCFGSFSILGTSLTHW